MKNLTIAAVVCLSVILPAGAQKLIIGSRLPDFKGTTWLSAEPQSKRPMLIEFYNPQNATSNKFFVKLGEIKSKYGDMVQIVVLTTQHGPDIDKIVTSHGTDYSVGYDSTGKVYQNFNVRYLPFTIVANSAGEMFWQGNLGNISTDILDNVK